jgi:hypothetical protein
MIEMIRFIVNYILMYRKDSGGGLYNCWKPSVPLSARWGDEKKLLGITSKMNDELFYQAEGKTAVGQKENGGFRYYIDSLSSTAAIRTWTASSFFFQQCGSAYNLLPRGKKENT